MPSDSSTLEDSDDIDLGWDDEPSSPSATTEPSLPTAARISSSARSARLASTLRDAAKVQRSPPPCTAPSPTSTPIEARDVAARPSSIPPRLSPPPKPTGRPRYSLRPVSVPPRPSSSSPSSERPRDLYVEIDVDEPVIPALSQAPEELPPAPAVATLASEVALLTEAPASIAPDDALEAPSPEPARSEWADTGVDSLGPIQLDATTTSSIPEFRARGPRRAAIALGTAASAGLIWLVAGAIISADGTAESPLAHPMTQASPAVAALSPAAVPPAPRVEPAGTSEAIAKPAPALSAESALPQTPGTISVAVHISPPDAFVFESGRHLGRGDVTVQVAPGAKVTLVAQLKGYRARSVVLDGRYTSVNIALRRAQASRSAASLSTRERPEEGAAAPTVEPSESAPRNDVTPTSDGPSQSSSASGSGSNATTSAGTTRPAQVELDPI
jgi:hypothetical protein